LVGVDHGNGEYVFAIEYGVSNFSKTKFKQDEREVHVKFSSVDTTDEFGFGRGREYGGLQLGFECYGTPSKTNHNASDGMASLEIVGMGCIKVDDSRKLVTNRKPCNIELTGM
jgi:hypothetical protein